MRLEPSILGAAYPQRLEHIGQDVLSHRGFSLLAECRRSGRIRRRSHFLTVASRSSRPVRKWPVPRLAASTLLHERTGPSPPFHDASPALAHQKTASRRGPSTPTLTSSLPLAASYELGARQHHADTP